MAPPVDFLTKSYLPLVNRLGPTVEAHLVRPGFYPAGGGEFTVHVRPTPKLGRLELIERGKIIARRVRALVARLPRHIAERECRTVAQETGWDADCFAVAEIQDARGPGNVVMIELEAEHVTEVFTAFGRLGVRAEDVAKEALCQAEEYMAAGVPVGKYLADQIMLPLGIGAYLGSGGGVFRTMGLSLHSTTHLEILQRFVEIGIQVEREDGGNCLVLIGCGAPECC
jgi:RNA 3'-terminal phosphate cyclase (ATP)